MIFLSLSIISYLLAFLLFLYKNFSRKDLSFLPYIFLIFGVLFYSIFLIKEFFSLKIFPIGDIYGMVSVIGNITVFVFLILARGSNFEILGGFTSFLALITTLFLIPSQKTGFSNPLYVLHIFSAGISYASIIFAGIISGFRLLFEKKLKKKQLYDKFMPLKILKKFEKVFIITSFIGLTFTLIFGSIWAKIFLGTHWVNDPKLVITLFLWIYYAFLSHTYVIKTFKPSQISYLSILGTILSFLALLLFRHSF